LIFFKGPASFTGEDVIELHCHGGAHLSQAILNRVLELGNDWGIKQAEAGEFSLRAYLNGKIDLVQAEAIADLINAQSDAAIKGAARSLRGQFSDSVNQLIEEITQLRILVESTLDFPEEEIEFLESSKANERLASILKKLQDLVEKTQQGKILRDGIRLALVGSPNVGKSSLLNCLLGEERAIVTPVAGTTRDRIEESITLQGVPVHLVDTAGLRVSADVVEQIGIARTWDAIEDADTIIFMRDLSTTQSGEDGGLEEKVKARANKKAHIIEVFNKLDLVDSQKRQLGISTSEKNTIHISAKTGDGIDALKERILSLAGWQANLAAGVFTARDRHLSAIAEAKESLLKAQAHGLNGNHSLDLFAEELRLSQDALGQITGKLLPDELLGKIFSEFCIGK
jgi:tRNA modification GTPase